MVKTKRQQLKSRKHQPQHPNKGKKRGKAGDLEQFCVQLDGLGLKIVQVTADGNCFFRSLADQLEGNEDEHMKYRLMVVKYIRKNREEFEPFIEDDVLFDDYCKSMEEDGTWAGHMELQAASLVTQCNICIHRMMSPRWYIQNFNSDRARMVHLSYHDGEHYNSVRLKYDDGVGPARVIIIKADANLSSASSQQRIFKSSATLHDKSVDAVAVNKVMSEAGCHDVKKVEEVLQEFNGDIDVAIQFLIAEGAADECSTNDDNCQKIDINSVCAQDEHGNHDAEKQEETHQNDCLLGQTVDDCEDVLTKNDHWEPTEKKIARNKVCPCGSRKKYKACCGSGAQKPVNVVIYCVVSEDAIINNGKINNLGLDDSPQEIHHAKGRKGKKQGRRKMEPVNTSPHESCKRQIDMGALCI